ncbi:SpoIID/LytB domain-containing protein [Paenibacillus sp. N1-5-1-14]|uniref:SpoIID/LytB domain-containing protein n=1 Tax=Paenibacillus radicibacter TaxID=2972488 RepID=UPI0021591E97|nr:SpoIID/LytB domain-containing protein [Paenibacillus radicibacter]MCR8644116.1 SpoIID/LytB domain-containing protein [Paenibacillus radicibacter]
MKLSQIWIQAGKYVLAGALLFSTTLPFAATSAYAAVPKLDQIRVALFMNTAKSSNTSVVTLKSDKGFDISTRSASGTIPLFNAADTSIRASADGFRVLLLETENQGTAKAIAEQLSSGADKVNVITYTKQGKLTYRVEYGYYVTKEQATAGIDTVLRNGTTSALIGAFKPVVVGNARLQAGNTGSEADAVRTLAVVNQAGLYGNVVAQLDAAGQAQYTVWVGDEQDAASLQTLQASAAQLLPGIALQAADNKRPYVIRKTEAGGVHYAFNGGNNQLLIHPKQIGVSVKEKSDNTYRGDIELSVYKDRLAVINEVDFEQYLYSVVGAEMGGSYPTEALKAQAVSARTYALMNGLMYDIAHVVDNTFDQAYSGMGREATNVIQAVEATRGEVVVDGQNKLVQPFYSASAGGVTADITEAWGGKGYDYLQSVKSPDEGTAEKWYRILLNDGKVGYVFGDYLKATGNSSIAGFSYYRVTEPNLNVRMAPSTFTTLGPVVGKLNVGEQVVVLEEVMVGSPYVWERMLDEATLSNLLAKNGVTTGGAVNSLEITKRGPSGRVTEISVNGKPVKVKTPDAIRTVLGSLPSTLFEIEQAGRYTIKGATAVNNRDSSQPVYALSGNQSQGSPVSQSQYFVLGANGKGNSLTSDSYFRIFGKGYGHGIGMSQYGARNYALQGYTYVQIIQAYYNGVTLTKG